jgi:hypothetical protein
MSEMRQRFDAIRDRVNELDRKVKTEQLSKEEKTKMLNEAVQLAISIGNIALEKMERGDTV